MDKETTKAEAFSQEFSEIDRLNKLVSELQEQNQALSNRVVVYRNALIALAKEIN